MCLICLTHIPVLPEASLTHDYYVETLAQRRALDIRQQTLAIPPEVYRECVVLRLTRPLSSS